jgi:hypothetical protein
LALSQIERKLLERVRELIECGKESYICYALTEANINLCDGTNDAEVDEADMRLSTFIMDQIEPYGVLGMWQQKHECFQSKEQTRIDRLAWIDWLLNEPQESN